MRRGAVICCLSVFQFAAEASARDRGGRRRWHDGSSWTPPEWWSDFDESDSTGVPKWQRKLCRKIGRLAESVPGISCDRADLGDGDYAHDSTRGLKSKLQAEETKSKRLQEDLHKERMEKQQKVQAKEREIIKEKTEKREKEREVEHEQTQSKHYKTRLEAKIRELENEKQVKREQQQITERVSAERDQASQLNRRLEAKVNKLERDLKISTIQKEATDKLRHQCSREKSEKFDQCQVYRNNDNAWVASLKDELKAAKAKLDAELKEKGLLVQERERLTEEAASGWRAKLDADAEIKREQDVQRELLEALEMEKARKVPVAADGNGAVKSSESSWTSTSLLIMTAVISLLLASILTLLPAQKVWHQRKEIMALRAELSEKTAELQTAELEIHAELGGMMKTAGASKNLGTDFTYHIYDEKVDHGRVRSIKIQCPGVRHSDVDVEIIFNGCIVKINREPSRGVDAAQWEKRFQFRPSEGLFEFKEDQAALDSGFLILVFRAFDFQSRPFRFPKHFDLAGTDVDGTYDFPEENATAGRATEPSVQGKFSAPGRLEMTAAAAAEFGARALEELAAETSGSPIDTEDYEATRAAVAQAAASSSAPGDSEIQIADTVQAMPGMPEAAMDSEASPEVTGEDTGAKKALGSEGSSDDFEKVNSADVSVVGETF